MLIWFRKIKAQILSRDDLYIIKGYSVMPKGNSKRCGREYSIFIYPDQRVFSLQSIRIGVGLKEIHTSRTFDQCINNGLNIVKIKKHGIFITVDGAKKILLLQKLQSPLHHICSFFDRFFFLWLGLKTLSKDNISGFL